MFPPVYVADIAQHEGQEVTLHGWLHNRRSSGKLHFLQVRDGTGTIQCVVFKGNVTPSSSTRPTTCRRRPALTRHGPREEGRRASPIGFELEVKDLRSSRGPRASTRSATRSTASPS